MTPTTDSRPSCSDHKTLSRRILCRMCGGEHWHRLTGPHEWTCQGCGAVFWQNPWVSDGHEMIRAPIYDDQGDETCQHTSLDSNQKSARPARETATVPAPDQSARCRPIQNPTRVRPVAVQAAFL